MGTDDDDDFGDLYTDVFGPLSSSIPPSSIPNPSPNPPSLTGGDRIPTKTPSSNQPIEAVASLSNEDPKDDWLPHNWIDDEDGVPVANFKGRAGSEFFQEDGGASVSGSVGDDAEIIKDEGFGVSEEKKIEIGDLDQEPVIPGLSIVPLANNGDLRISNVDNWDSDSEDDLQIVLNDNVHVPMVGETNENDDDDGEEDLVIVTDEDQQHHHHQAMEGEEWGEGELQLMPDGERKEESETAKGNIAVGNVASGLRIGYSNHGFHPQHHSMFKYIRPSATTPCSPTVGPPGQVHPPSTMSSIAGRGRGDWRPAGIRGIAGALKSFRSGFGPGWANNSSRAFGGGLDFTLPSHKTIFDVDVESFEEKPWSHPGVDITDYFNFGLDEDKWKEYCKQLDRLRLESTMQSKIHVYESGRSDQDYDPDLPPELADAAGHHDISADKVNHGKIDKGKSDFSGQGRGLLSIRSSFPPGRAIQVETGYGERLPSIDTRPPRTRDADAIIEIVLQDSMDDSTICNNVVEQPEKDIQGEELKGVHEAEGDRRSESESYDHYPQTFNGHRRETGLRRISHASEVDGIMPFPPESPPHYNCNSRLRSPINPAGSIGTHRGGRLSEGASRGRYTSASGNHSNDSTPTRSVQENKHIDHQKEIPGSSMEANQTSELSPPIAAETAGELSIEQKNDERDSMLALGDSMELEVEETSDFRVSGENLADDNIVHSSKKQKLSSRDEQTVIRDNADGDDLRATCSDNSRAKSRSSNKKRHESGDEEVQGGCSRRMDDARRHRKEDEHTFRLKDDHGREGRNEMDRKHMGSKGREAMYHSYPRRDWGSYSLHPVRGKSEGLERPRETDNFFGQRREDDTHGRRIKDEDIKRERNEEAGSRNRSKIRGSDRNDKDDGTHLKKRLDDGDRRSHNREGGPRLRERDDVLSRRDNIDDHQIKRKKNEEHSRIERTGKEDSSRKTDREDNPDHRRREESSRMRDKAEDHHSSKHKNESWHQRERDDRQRFKYPYEDPLLHREREEGRGTNRSGRVIEDKPLDGNGRNKSDSKLLVFDKDYRDRRRHGEQSRRGDQAGEENDLQHKGEDVPARQKYYSNEERSSRHERLSVHGDRPGASDNSQVSRERHREVTRKNKDTEGRAQMGVGKREREDHSSQRNEKVSSKGTNEEESNNDSLSNMVNQLQHSSQKQVEGDLASDDESQYESKRGCSKLERRTSRKERDYTATDNLQSSSSRDKEVGGTTNDILPTDELPRTEGNDVSDSDPGVAGGQTADRSGDDRDRHLNTVEKLKRRSERFKLPMPGEKDVALSK